MSFIKSLKQATGLVSQSEMVKQQKSQAFYAAYGRNASIQKNLKVSGCTEEGLHTLVSQGGLGSGINMGAVVVEPQVGTQVIKNYSLKNFDFQVIQQVVTTDTQRKIRMVIDRLGGYDSLVGFSLRLTGFANLTGTRNFNVTVTLDTRVFANKYAISTSPYGEGSEVVVFNWHNFVDPVQGTSEVVFSPANEIQLVIDGTTAADIIEVKPIFSGPGIDSLLSNFINK